MPSLIDVLEASQAERPGLLSRREFHRRYGYGGGAIGSSALDGDDFAVRRLISAHSEDYRRLLEETLAALDSDFGPYHLQGQGRG